MRMPASQVPASGWTEEGFFAQRDLAPEGERWELVDGSVLVTPSPHWRHQLASASLFGILDRYARERGIGRALTAPTDIRLEPGMITQPDLFVVPLGHLVGSPRFISALLLAVEILSPSSARFDRVIKRSKYQRHVAEYWVVDQEARVIERWQSGDARPAILADELIWTPAGAAAPLVIDIAALFTDAEVR